LALESGEQLVPLPPLGALKSADGSLLQVSVLMSLALNGVVADPILAPSRAAFEAS
jgi:hypothetical protein